MIEVMIYIKTRNSLVEGDCYLIQQKAWS